MGFGRKTAILKVKPDYFFLAHERWSLKVQEMDNKNLRAFKELLSEVGAEIIPHGALLAACFKSPELSDLKNTFEALLQDENHADCIHFQLHQPHLEGQLLRRLKDPVLQEVVEKVTICQDGHETHYDCRP